MDIRVAVGGIQWLYSELPGGGGILTALKWPAISRAYIEEDLPWMVEGINRELKIVQLRSFRPRRERIIPTSPLKVTIEQVREAMSDFPELFMEAENGTREN